MEFEEETRILISCAKDKAIKVWKLPEKWIDEDIEKYEQEEIKNLKDSAAMLKIQQQNQNNLDDSDFDDLCGWDYHEK